MARRYRGIIVVLFSLVILNILPLHADLIVTNVDRTIDLSTQIPKITSQVTLENKGSSAAREFLLAIEEDSASNLSYLEVTVRIILSFLPAGTINE